MESLKRKADQAVQTVNTTGKRVRRGRNIKVASTPVSPSASRLLALPGELRNKIYKFSLIVGDEHDTEYPILIAPQGRFVKIIKSLKIPPLLSVSRQVRQEASPYWYTSNVFEVELRDYDPTLYLAFHKHVHGLSGNVKSTKLWFRVTGNPSWANLMKWCYAVWSGSPMCEDAGASRRLALVRAAHKIALMSKGDSWEDCEKQLRVLRGVFAQIDNRWLD